MSTAPTIERINNDHLRLKSEPLNSSKLSYTNDQGVRLSLPLYVDLTTAQRKDLFNQIRTVASQTHPLPQQTRTISGLVVENAASGTASVEQYLGMTLDILRTVMFQRGGIPIDLVLRLQAVAGVEYISIGQIKAALTQRKNQVEQFITDNPFNEQSTN